MNNDNLRINFLRKNKDTIINYYNKTNSLDELNGVLNNLNNTSLNIKEIEEIKIAIVNRMNELNVKSLKDVLEEAKNKNSNIKDINIVETRKEINNKDYYGFRNNINYLRVYKDGENKLFEIPNNYVDKVKEILELNQNITIKDLLEKIKPYIEELNIVEMDYKTNLDKEVVTREINNIQDAKTKQQFLDNIASVLKERIEINKYISEKGLEKETLRYSINSSGERIYYVGDNIIKFLDNETNMYVLTPPNNDFVSSNKKEQEEKEFEKETKDKENEEEKINEIPNSLDELNTEFYINAINFVMDKIYKSESLDKYEEKLIEIFLHLCVNTKEDDIPINLYEIYNTYFEYLYNYNDYYNDNIRNMFQNKIEFMKEEKKKKSNEKQLILENNDKFGFADITLIVCLGIVVIIIILFILLVK